MLKCYLWGFSVGKPSLVLFSAPHCVLHCGLHFVLIIQKYIMLYSNSAWQIKITKSVVFRNFWNAPKANVPYAYLSLVE